MLVPQSISLAEIILLAVLLRFRIIGLFQIAKYFIYNLFNVIISILLMLNLPNIVPFFAINSFAHIFLQFV
jgi:hypothetical protein